MKRTIAVASGMFVLAVGLYGQDIPEDRIPESVLSTFRTTYGTISDVSWEREDDMFEAEFDLDGMEVSLLITPDGTIVATEQELPLSEIPASVRSAIQNLYPGASLEEGERITTHEGMTYEVEIRSGGKEYELQFDEEGNLIGKEEEGGTSDED